LLLGGATGSPFLNVALILKLMLAAASIILYVMIFEEYGETDTSGFLPEYGGTTLLILSFSRLT
jgi:hypothetical protein